MALQLLVVILAVLAVAVAWVVSTGRWPSRGRHELPLLFFGSNDSEQNAPLRRPPARPGWPPSPVAEPQPEVLSLPLEPAIRERVRGVDRAAPPRPAPERGWVDAPAEEQATTSVAATGDAGPAEPVRLPVEVDQQGDATVRLLPGRLQIVRGAGAGEEMRFVQVPGRELAVTIGRGSGPPDTHVQLRSPTVSRLHARMRFQEGSWYVSNLSKTNPVVVNGVQLLVNGAECLLLEGDRLELGDVIVLFKAR